MIKLLALTVLFLLTFLLLFSQNLSAQTTPEPPPLSMNDDILQTKTKEISQTLRCAVCQSESIWESNATLAIQMRDIIRERLLAGETGDEIRAYFVSRYGDYIVFKPRFRGINMLLWGGPFILLAIGMAVLLRKLKKWTARPEKEKPEPLAPIDETQRQRIEDELSSLK